METHERRYKRTNRLLLLAFVVLLFVVPAVALPRVLTGRALAYDKAAKRDAKTGYMEKMAPRDLGPEDAPRAALFVHGFSGSPSNYGDLPDAVARDGWRVRCMVTPGHCKTTTDFESATADQMLDGIVAELRALKEKHAQVVLIGHSLGGAMSTLVAAREPVDAVILCAPFFGLTSEELTPISTRDIVEFISPVVPCVPRAGVTQPVAFAPNRQYVVSHAWIPAKAGLTALELGERVQSEKAIEKVNCPVLIIHSAGDRVTSLAASKKAFEQFPNPNKRGVWLEKSDHIIFFDYERPETIFEVRAFLDRLPAA